MIIEHRGLRGLLSLASLLPMACSDRSAPVVPDVLSAANTTPASFGWLGARVQPLTANLEIVDGDNTRVPGGVVLRQVQVNGPLAQAGAQVGDVVVAVGDEWVPIKPDPTLDVVERIERAISGGQDPVLLSAWRQGALVDLPVPAGLPALEVGLPLSVQRFERGVDLAVEWLLDHAPVRPSLEQAALGALALRAAGAFTGDESPSAWREAAEQYQAQVRQEAVETQDPVALSLALLAAAEEVGPLPAAAVVLGAPRIMSVGGTDLPEGLRGMPGGGSFTIQLDDPSQLEHMLKSLGAEGSVQFGQITAVGGEGGQVPPEILESVNLPEGAEIQVQGSPPPEVLEAMRAGGMGGPAPTSVADALALVAPEHLPLLEPLQAWSTRLQDLQQEDGSFLEATQDAEGRFHATALALTALGHAQRAGVTLDPEIVELAATFLRAQVHDGRVAAAVARGAHRHREAGRAAIGAVPFLAVGCAEQDEFLQSLLDYSDHQGRGVQQGTEQLPIHLLATALARRTRGLSHWQTFYNDFRIALVCWQDPDGSFHWPGMKAEDAWTGTALGTLVLAMQSGHLPLAMGTAENPFAPVIDGTGADPSVDRESED